MKRDLPYYIARFLLVRPELNIPGFGRFYSNYKSAFFTENEIHPPSYSREFSPSPNSSDLDDFCDFLKYQTGRGEAFIKKTVKDFIAELKKGAKRKAGIPVEGLGTFTLLNGKIHGEIDNNTFGHHFSGFQNVDNRILGSLLTHSAGARIKDTADSPQVEEQTDDSVMLPGVVLSPDDDSASMQSEDSTTAQKNEKSKTKVKIEEDEVSLVPLPIPVPADHTSVATVPVALAQKTSSAHTSAKAISSLSHTRRSGPEESSSQTYRSLFWLLGIILLLLVISAFLLLTDVLDGGSKAKYSQDKDITQIESGEENISGAGTDKKSTKEIEEELESSLSATGSEKGSSEVTQTADKTIGKSETGGEESETAETVGGSETETAVLKSEKTDDSEGADRGTGSAANVPGTGKDCMVVVGAFRVLSNADRMQAKLAQMGYQPYTEVRKGLTHVGVLKPCRTSELREVLYRGRAEIDGGTWVLRVHGTPPD